jgi:hypothetical protein
MTSTPVNTPTDQASVSQHRRDVALQAAELEGLLGPKDENVGGRVPAQLLARAKQCAGVDSTSELLLYALVKIAIEDDFGPRLVARKGRVPRGTFAD